MLLSELFRRCLYADYVQTPDSGDYAIERIGSTLYIYLEHSKGREDWENNLNFPAKPYKRMGKTVWRAHRGFLKVWKSMESYLAYAIGDPAIEKIVTVGYSHGAALAVLCHEYIWYHRPDLRETIEGYGFGSPRVIWGALTADLQERWAGFTIIRNLDDLVTHLPPAFLGYVHVGKMLEIGEKGKYSPADAHREENILNELEREGV
jgi:predicted lipase